MDPSALENVSRSLEASLDCWGWLILASTAVVVLGLVIEYWEPVHECIEEWLRPAAAFPWRKFWGLAGGILVTAGVAGELGFTYKASRIETSLRANNHQIELLLNQGVSGALQNAAEANDRATANDLAAQRLKAENLRLEAIIAPRSLSLGAQQQIANACSGFKGNGAVVESYGLDAEGYELSSQILAIFGAIGVGTADERATKVSTGRPEVGIHVRTDTPSELPFASCVANAFTNAGKLATFLNDPTPPLKGAMIGGGGQAYDARVPHITVTVGVKPLPVLTISPRTEAR